MINIFSILAALSFISPYKCLALRVYTHLIECSYCGWIIGMFRSWLCYYSKFIHTCWCLALTKGRYIGWNIHIMAGLRVEYIYVIDHQLHYNLPLLLCRCIITQAIGLCYTSDSVTCLCICDDMNELHTKSSHIYERSIMKFYIYSSILSRLNFDCVSATSVESSWILAHVLLICTCGLSW